MRAFIILVACGVTIGLAGAQCPLFWTYYGKSCYKFVSQDKYWGEAEQECFKLSPSDGRIAHLVSISDKTEQQFVHALFMDQGAANHNAFWLGGTDQYSEGRS